MNFFLQDMQFGIRTLLKKPGFTLTAVLTLALGIGANTAIFSILNGILFRPLPSVRNPDQLVVLANRDDHMEFPHGLSYVDFLDYKQQCDELEALAIYTPFPISISGEGRAERTWAICASGDYFSLYGTPALHGVTFQNDDSSPTGGEALLVMGYDFWQRSYGGDPSIVGKVLEINGAAYTVAGIMPEGFNGNETIIHIDVYLPLTTMHMLRDEFSEVFEERESHIFRTTGRVKEGVTIQEARTSLQMIAKRLGEEYPDSNAGIELIVAKEKDARPEPSLYGVMKPISIAFMGLVSLVLFIACANVANLLLARGMSRGREFATRVALGASRGRIIRQMLTETLMLALLGGVVGVFIAEVVSSALTSMTNNMPGDIPIKTNFHPDMPVYGFAFLAASLACVVAGLLPALRSSRVNLTDALKDGRTSSAGSGRHRLRKMLVVSQLSVSLLLLISAGMFVKSLINARNYDMGFEQGNLLMLSVDPISQRYEPDQCHQLFDDMVSRVETVPGVLSASIAGFVPFDGSGLQATNLLVVGGEDFDEQEAPTVFFNTVDHHYFQTMGVPILQGRGFTDMDTSESQNVLVVNQVLAKQLWPGEDSIGKQVYFGDLEGPLCEVVGIARDGKYMIISEDPRPFMYRPLSQGLPLLKANLHVRTDIDPMSLAPTIRNVIQELDQNLSIFDVKDMEMHLMSGNALMPFRMGALMVGSFGTLGLILAAIGIYGVISYSVGSRTHEFGVRMALGAGGHEIRSLVLKEGMWLTGVGVLVGLGLTVLIAPVLQGMLLDVNSIDGVLYGLVTGLLVLIAILACFIPARRATKVDPMIALRHE